MTTTARSATTFSTATVTVPARPTATVHIGTLEVHARAPKVDVWREVTAMLAKLDLLRELTEAGEDTTAEQEAQLVELRLELSDLDAMEKALITGVEYHDDAGTLLMIEGGFLRRCMSAEDWQAVWAEWHDDDSDVDINYLFEVVNQLREGFQSYFEARHEAVGLPVPEGPKSRSGKKKTA